MFSNVCDFSKGIRRLTAKKMSSRVGSRPKGRMSMDQEVGLSESEEGDDGSDLEEMEVRAEVDSPPEENQAEKDEKKEKKISKPRAPRPKLTLELLEVK